MSKKIITKDLRYDNTKYYIEMGIDIEKRCVFIDDSIKDEIVGQITRTIQKMVELDSEAPINVYINSAGGSILSGLSLYDILSNIPAPIRTIALGKVCSMGLILFLAGDERYAHDSVRFMHHEASTHTWGKLSEIEDDVKEVKILEEICDTIVASKTDKSTKWWKNKARRKDFWFGKKEALEFGVITSDESFL